MNIDMQAIKFDERGLIPAIVQDVRTREVLTLAYMSEESLTRTIETGQTWFWSRSRNTLWHKGETSGNTQDVVDLVLDCDGDAVLVLVKPSGPACHTGATSCFHSAFESEVQSLTTQVERRETEDFGDLLSRLYEVIQSRDRERPEGSYTAYLFDEGLDKILKKVGEEASETIIAAKNENTGQFVAEVSDLIYHLLVLLVARGINLDEIRQELARRRTESVNGGASEGD
jgi:phosphoribosyl-AMP cyclohydrolase / phosphoribosyl-ATP pyrophosphohydrolase